MNAMVNSSKLLAAAIGAALLAGCNAVEDVQEAPSTTLPAQTVVLAGTINGLGSTRSIVIVNNGDNNTAIGAVAPVPVTPVNTLTAPVNVSTPFSFGARPVGSPYNVTIRTQPYGKSCTVVNGSGTLNAAAPPQVVINCISNVPRFNLTVALNTAFSGTPGAKVRLTTEEAIYETVPAAGATSVTFNSVLFNGAGAGAPNPSPAFSYTVSASNTVNGVTNRCPVTAPTGSNVTANVTPTSTPASPSVGACSFTISGSLNYSLPPGVTTAPALGAGGVTLELRDVQGNAKATQTVSAFGNFTFNDTATTTAKQFLSNSSGVYDVVVTSQPAGQMCVVGDGGFASLFVLVNGNPTNITATGVTSTGGTPSATTTHVVGTRLAVFCRNRPTTANTLAGVFRLTKVAPTIRTITKTRDTAGVITTSPVATRLPVSEWRPFDTTAQNTASNAILTFFDDGSFLYGQHNNSSQVEHGFYDYNSITGTLRFTIHTDTNTSTTFPTTFDTVATPTNLGPTNTPGISALPAAFTFTTAPALPAAQRHQALCNVRVIAGTLRKITGTAGGPTLCGTAIPVDPSPPADPAAPVSPATTSTTSASTITRVDWELTEPRNVTAQITGRWTTQDHREVWVYDSLTNYGFHVGVNGGAANLQSACFTIEDNTASSSFLTRRGSNTGCYAWNNPSATQVYLFSGNEAVDIPSASAGSPLLTQVPGFVGRMPGGGTAFDGRSPSPIYYNIAPPATFFTSLREDYKQFFPTPVSLTWCPSASEVLGVRATLNGEPVTSPIVPVLNKPLYFCRQ